MNFLLLFLIFIFIIINLVIGLIAFKKNKTVSDYLVSGRNIHPYIMAMSYGATFISTSAIIGFGGVASVYGLSLLWLVFANIFIGIFIAFIFYGKKTRKLSLNLNAHTFPELLGKSLNSKFIEWFSGLIIFLSMPLYISAVLIGGARLMEVLAGIPFTIAIWIFAIMVTIYVVFGGLKGVMYADALQGTVMVVGMLILLIFTYSNNNGILASHIKLSEMEHLIPPNLKAQGLRGWTSFPAFNSIQWWTLVSSLMLGVGIGVLAQPQLIVRYMTVKSDKEINRALIIGSIFILITVGTPYIVGSLSNIYFYEKYKQISIAVVKGNIDSVIPKFIDETMPAWFKYIFVLAIISAALSTLSSQLHTVGTSIGRDFFMNFIKKPDKKYEIIYTKIGIFLSLIITLILTFKMGESIIARATAIFFGIMAASFLAPYTSILYFKKITKEGAIAGIISGLFISIFSFLFLHSKESSVLGICKLITGKDKLFSGIIEFIDPIVYALPASIFFTIIVSLLTFNKNKSKISVNK